MRRTIAIASAFALTVGVACSSDNGGGATATPATSNTPAATSSATTPSATTVTTPIPTVQGEPTVTASGLTIIDVAVGSGSEAKAGDTVTAQYTGYLADGTIFDGPSIHGGPVQFPLSGVIAGWQEGVPGMKIGGTRRLIIPPDLAYGAEANGSIPANSTLTFDIELVSIP